MAERPKGYGMTAELADKKAAKYDANLDLKARQWLEEIVGEPFPTGLEPDSKTFHEALKDGVYLCKAINVLQPGSAPKINQSKMAFKMMENIGFFLSGCENYGCPKTDIFQTVDLYEAQNIPQVINGIIALARKAGKKGVQTETQIAPKESSENPREFSEQQLQEGKKVIGLQMGSNKGASQAGQTAYGLGRQIRDDRY